MGTDGQTKQVVAHCGSHTRVLAAAGCRLQIMVV